MTCGYTGRVLRVDFRGPTLWIQEPDDTFYRLYFGGRAVAAYYLLQELSPSVDALDPSNVLVFAPGVITGFAVSGQGRNGVGAKSPLTGAFGSAEVGGFWGAELKHAGFDAIVIQGQADRPVYLWIHHGKAEIRDASHLWGLPTGPCQATIRDELGGRSIRTALIGPAGERLVRYACISNDLNHFAGRGGLGAVMGSKNLKGIAVQGTGSTLSAADPQGVQTLAKWMVDHLDLVAELHDSGTAWSMEILSAIGGLPTFNFQTGSFVGAEAISGQRMRDTILKRRATCYACAVQCKRIVEVDGPHSVDPQYGGPEYETLAAFGSNCGVDNLPLLAKANELCAAYGLDSISTGAVIAFAMECFKRGLLTRSDTDGIELRWGNASSILQMLNLIIRREGIGDLLAEGVARTAHAIGAEAEEIALHVKGQELPMHEPRIKHGLGVGYAVSPTGADHMHNLHDTAYISEGDALRRLRDFGDFNPMPVDDLGPEKMRLFVHHVNWRHFLDCALMCHFLPYSPEQMANLVNAVTGWDTDIWELLRVGERAATLARMFNVRQGFSRADDMLPRRFFKPFMIQSDVQERPLDSAAFEAAISTYYKMMGWDAVGIPTRERLEELNIAQVVQ